MAKIDKIYHDLSKAILDYGYIYLDESRGKNCKQISSCTLAIPLNEFPLITTKQMFTKGIVGELLWFLRGESDIRYLNENNINIWNQDALNFSNKNGGNTLSTYVGRNYGVQWRNWTNVNTFGDVVPGFDQITNLIINLKKKPIGRRHIVTAWNPAELDQTALPPCHWAWEVIPRPLFDFEKKLYPNQEYGFDLKWHQRSVDTFLGLPFNIASYALLANIIGKMTNFVPLNIIGDLSNVHFYEPHIEVVKEQLLRNTDQFQGCNLTYSANFNNALTSFDCGDMNFDEFINAIEIKDFIFEDYQSFDKLKADMYAPID